MYFVISINKMSGEERLVTEVPSSLKQLARLVVRGFYTIEDALIVDMLVRNPCKYKIYKLYHHIFKIMLFYFIRYERR